MFFGVSIDFIIDFPIQRVINKLCSSWIVPNVKENDLAFDVQQT